MLKTLGVQKELIPGDCANHRFHRVESSLKKWRNTTIAGKITGSWPGVGLENIRSRNKQAGIAPVQDFISIAV